MYEMTTVFESSKDPNELILGLKQVFKTLGEIKDLSIFIYDKHSKTLKNFAKMWENLPENDETKELLAQYKIFEENDKKEHIIKNGAFYFPLFKQKKINGIVKIEGIPDKTVTENFMPLLTRQVSLAVVHLKYFENVKNNARFYETVRNIAKITETQYDLSYILPIMGEMIDSFIREHLIYIFLKNKNKKEYKLIWPNKCLMNNINDYLNGI